MGATASLQSSLEVDFNCLEIPNSHKLSDQSWIAMNISTYTAARFHNVG